MPPDGGRSAGWVIFGSGWVWPASIVIVFVALMYLPAHLPSSGGIDQLTATVASLYVVGLSVAAPRLLRGVIVRAGGNRDPIVLLGRGPDPLIGNSVRARWRLTASAGSCAASLMTALVAALLTVGADPATYAHAVGGLAVGVNLVIAAAILVPVPGFAGWTLLLGLVDAAGVPPDRRVRSAARLARFVGVPMLLTVGIAVVSLGNLILAPVSFVLALLAWTQSGAAAARDAAVRFLAGHRAGELARPVMSRVDPDEPLDDLIACRRRANAVTIVEASDGVLGAIGPKQIAERGVATRGERCRDVMVPLVELRPQPATAPAADLLPLLAGHGFALVGLPDGLGYVEESDLATQIRIWVALGDRGIGGSARRRRGRRPAASTEGRIDAD